MEDNDREKNNVDDKLREAVSDELSTYTDPQAAKKAPAPVINPLKTEVRASETPIDPNQSQSQKTPVKPIVRTYKSDMEETIQAGHLSSINIAVSENNKLFQNAKQDLSETKKIKINKNIVLISIVLIAGGMLAIFIPYLLVQKQASPQTQTTNAAPGQAIIATDLEETINLSDINPVGIDTTLNQRVNQSSTALGQIKNFVLTEGSATSETPISASEFLTLINADVPDDIARNLLTPYMFGMYNYNGNQEFLILKVSDYDTAYSGMLSWETDLWQNFKNLFGLQDPTAATSSIATMVSTTTASSTPASSSSAVDQNSLGIEVEKFQDAEFDNKDARVVKDANGNIVFLYSIIDPNTIVIATSPDTLEEIISRASEINTVTQ